MVGVLHRRALRQYGEHVRQYIALRQGDLVAAEPMMGRLRAILTSISAQDLTRPPGLRARVYREARLLVQEFDPRDGSKRVDLPWESSIEHDPVALWALRTEVLPEDAELLELRHARDLTPSEIAFVLDAPVEDVLDRLRASTERVRELLARHGAHVPNLRRLLMSAYTLKSTHTIELSGDSLDEYWEPLPPGTVIGERYAIESRVGTGSFGDVYRASDTSVPGHVVALKLLHQPSLSPAAQEHALREVRLIASVFHPSVVQFKDHGWHEQRLWFVMPWYEGESLEARLTRKPLSRPEAQKIFSALASGLSAMHAAGIRHQDIKPDNILLTRLPGAGSGDVLPVLIDLGVAAKEAELVVAGTPTYFAPEVASQFWASDEPPAVTAKADIFSLALALRNALEPSTQEEGPTGPVETFIEHRARSTPPLPTSPELKFLLPDFKRWLHSDPDMRPGAASFRAELEVLTRPERRRARRRGILRWLVPIGIAVMFVFASVGYVFHHEMQVQERKTARLASTSQNLRTDLRRSQQTRRKVEAAAADARRRYQSSQMTRQQLEKELVEHETQLTLARGSIGELRSKQRRMASDARVVRKELGKAEAARLRLAMENEQKQEELSRAKQTAEEARGQASNLESTVAALQAQLNAERAKSETLDNEVASAVRARAQAESELRRLRGGASDPSDQPLDELPQPSDVESGTAETQTP